MVDIGGGDSRLVDALLHRGLSCLTVLDVSSSALMRARARLGARQDAVRWIEADVTGDWHIDHVDVWHDRAVFHFLTEPADRRRYVAKALEVVKPGGHVVVATFAADGPRKCSGLDVVRCSPESLTETFGTRFHLIESVQHRHVTPAGVVQPFTYVVFQTDSLHGASANLGGVI